MRDLMRASSSLRVHVRSCRFCADCPSTHTREAGLRLNSRERPEERLSHGAYCSSSYVNGKGGEGRLECVPRRLSGWGVEEVELGERREGFEVLQAHVMVLLLSYIYPSPWSSS